MPKATTVKVGQKYGLLEVIGLRHEERSGRKRLVADCQCRCGQPTSPLAADLGKTLSCGCGGTAIERKLRRWNTEPIPDMTDGTVFFGELLVVGAWRNGSGGNVKMNRRDEVWVLLQCPQCLRHLLWHIKDAEKRKAESCGCAGRPRYVTVEEQEERHKNRRKPDWDMELQNSIIPQRFVTE